MGEFANRQTKEKQQRTKKFTRSGVDGFIERLSTWTLELTFCALLFMPLTSIAKGYDNETTYLQ
jgi:hypothetical protein